ncbi:PAS domain S-box protein [Noviherbaspirillum sp.]|mgnify:CR=1 FL=1|uniref:sensor domain-containing protein n=1 Tax=Noviherbaspirillum sp. TaxID=1926288 RepID=UPI0025D44EA7|nr:PAS domain S-box protein [Noviherbaspirillum sp.]
MLSQTLFSERRFLSQKIRDVVNAIPAAFFVKDRHSKIILMNQACEEQWGLAFDDVYGTDASQFFPPEQMQWFLEKDREVFAGGQQIDFEENFWNEKRKENRIGHTVKKPIYDSDGKPLYLVGITIDITECKQASERLRASDEKLRSLFELAPVGIALNDMQGRFIEFNDAFQRICDYPRDELRALDYWALTPREYGEHEALQLKSLAETGCYGPYEKEYIRRDGSRVPVRLNGVQVQGTDGQPCIWSIVENITEHRRIEESMKLASLIYQSSSEGIMVTDELNRIVDVNPAFTRITGYELAEIKGRNPRLMQSGMHSTEFYQQFWNAIHGRGSWQGEIWDRRKDGQLMAKWVNVSVIRSEDGKIYRYVAQFSDITEKKRMDELIWRQANFDQLTDLPNRRLFRDRLEQEIKKANRTGMPLALLFIDLDHFKEINDTLGHDKGDILLTEASQRIRRWVRETDTLARLGGDEFTVVIPDFGNTATIERIAQHIIQELNAPFSLGSEQGRISASIGITIYPADADTLEDLLKQADRAMYLAKMRGRNCYAYYSETPHAASGAAAGE